VKKFHFLINPVSGGGQGQKVFDFLPEIMGSMGFSAEEWRADLSLRDGFAEQIHSALQATECLIAVGGDGTVSAVLKVLMESGRSQDVRIGLIPLGTGNDLARVLNLYNAYVNKGLLFLVRRLVEAEARPFDLWKVNESWVMANYFSSGIDARIASDFNRDRAEGRIPGNSVLANKLHYVKRFFQDRAHRLGRGEVRIRNEHDEWLTYSINNNRTVIVGNIPSFASGSNPFQNSYMADGLLEVVRVPRLASFLAAVVLGGNKVLGDAYKRCFMPSIKAREIYIDIEPGEYLQLDGEDMGGQLTPPVHIAFACQVQMLALRD
jgi:diacylglycerol kinase family enzyme